MDNADREKAMAKLKAVDRYKRLDDKNVFIEYNTYIATLDFRTFLNAFNKLKFEITELPSFAEIKHYYDAEAKLIRNAIPSTTTTCGLCYNSGLVEYEQVTDGRSYTYAACCTCANGDKYRHLVKGVPIVKGGKIERRIKNLGEVFDINELIAGIRDRANRECNEANKEWVRQTLERAAQIDAERSNGTESSN